MIYTIVIISCVLMLGGMGGVLVYLHTILQRFNFGANVIQVAVERIEGMKLEIAQLRAANEELERQLPK